MRNVWQMGIHETKKLLQKEKGGQQIEEAPLNVRKCFPTVV
jgi:hypothetical protein